MLLCSTGKPDVVTVSNSTANAGAGTSQRLILAWYRNQYGGAGLSSASAAFGGARVAFGAADHSKVPGVMCTNGPTVRIQDVDMDGAGELFLSMYDWALQSA